MSSAKEPYISDFMANQRFSLSVMGQVFHRNAGHKYIPQKFVPYLQKIQFGIIFFCLYHISVLLMITVSRNLSIGGGSFHSILSMLSTMVVYTLMPFKLVYFQLRSKYCNDLMDYMNRHFHQRSARGLTYVSAYRSYKWGQTFTTLYVWLLVFSCTQFLIDPIISEERVLLLEIFYPFDETKSPMYEILIVIQTIAQIAIALNFSNTCVFSLGTSLALCAQFDILFCNIKNLEYTVALQHGRRISKNDAQRLRTLQAQINVQEMQADVSTFPFCDEALDDLDDLLENAAAGYSSAEDMPKTDFSWEDSENITRLLRECVEHHQHLIYCADQLEFFHNPICLCKFIVLTMQLCFLALNVVSLSHKWSKTWNEGLYLFDVALDSFFSAYAGQILIDQSTRVRDFLYNIRWYDMDAKLRAELQFILLKSQKPLQMTGGKFFVLKYETFIVMCKLAFSYFTLLTKE